MVGQWCLDQHLDYYLHTPSLTQHIGDTSTIWKGSKTTGRRRAATFVGEETNISSVVGQAGKSPPVSSSPPSPT